MQVKKQQLEQGMEQQTVSKLGKEYVKAVYCHPADLNYSLKLYVILKSTLNAKSKIYTFFFYVQRKDIHRVHKNIHSISLLSKFHSGGT